MSTLTKLFFFQHISLQCFILHAARLAVLDIEPYIRTVRPDNLLHCYFVTLLLCFFVTFLFTLFHSSDLTLELWDLVYCYRVTSRCLSAPSLYSFQHRHTSRKKGKARRKHKMGNQSKVRPILGNIFNFLFSLKKSFCSMFCLQIWEACVVLRAIFWSVRSATLAFLLY